MNFKQATCAVILALGSVLGVALSGAQQPGKMTRVGFLGTGPAPTPATSYAPLQAFRQGLDELGYVDGRDVVIETRWAEGRIDQLPALAAELVGLRVDILVGVGAVVARAAKSATTTIPVVMAVVIDPVNLVAERPGGNLTGLTTFDPQEARKKLALLQEVVPGLARAWRSSGIKRCGTRWGMQSRHVHWVCSRRVSRLLGLARIWRQSSRP